MLVLHFIFIPVLFFLQSMNAIRKLSNICAELNNVCILINPGAFLFSVGTLCRVLVHAHSRRPEQSARTALDGTANKGLQSAQCPRWGGGGGGGESKLL